VGMCCESNFDLHVAHLEADITDTTSLLPQETHSAAVNNKSTFLPAFAGCALSSPSVSALCYVLSATQLATRPRDVTVGKTQLCIQAVTWGYTSSIVLMGTS